jgi:hypothetical protein
VNRDSKGNTINMLRVKRFLCLHQCFASTLLAGMGMAADMLLRVDMVAAAILIELMVLCKCWGESGARCWDDGPFISTTMASQLRPAALLLVSAGRMLSGGSGSLKGEWSGGIIFGSDPQSVTVSVNCGDAESRDS